MKSRRILWMTMSGKQPCWFLKLAVGGSSLAYLAGMYALKQVQQSLSMVESVSDMFWDETLPTIRSNKTEL